MPYYILHNYDELAKLEKQRIARVEQAHAVAANAILTDDDHSVKTILLMLPYRVIYVPTSNNTFAPVTADTKVKVVMRELTIAVDVGVKMKKKARTTFHPATWLLRVVSVERRLLKYDQDEAEDDLEDAFKGMVV